MNRHQKLTLTAAGLLFLALALLLWPSAPKSGPDAGSAEVAPPVNRQPRPAPLPGSRPKRDFSTFVKLSTKTEFPKLTREQIDSYLQARSRSAASLLTAFRLSEDEAFLREAMEKFPNNPQVQLASLRMFADPAKRLEILESLKLTDPENGIVDCLSARALFDLGKNDEAVAALSQSVGRPIRDYTVLSCQDNEEAYLAAGFPPLEAKMTALFQSTKPLVIQMRKLVDGLQKQRESAGLAGDDAAVQTSRDIQLQLAGQLSQGGFLVDSLVAFVLENKVLKEIDTPEARARIEEMAQQKNSMVEASKRVSALMETSAVPENDWLLYFDRAKLFGEKSANDWMLGKYPDL
jgi:tetratricopeptide (TPR) repeat protein